MNYVTPPLVTGDALDAYFMSHVESVSRFPEPYDGGIFTLHTDLKVFKKVYARPFRRRYAVGDMYAIVNLVIPAGAKVYAKPLKYAPTLNCRKMRASEARVHSIATWPGGAWRVRGYAANRCINGKEFVYEVGKRVVPDRPFSAGPTQCAPGIHFFLNVGDALRYAL